MPTISEVLMTKVAEVAPAIYQFMNDTAEEVRQSPFRDEIVERLDGIFKKANAVAAGLGAAAGEVAGQAAQQGGRFAQFMKSPAMGTFGRAAAGIAGVAATGVALSLAGDAYDALRRGLTKSRNYKAMLAANPDLKGMPGAYTMRAFSTLHRFNPEFSSDPYVSGSWVRNQVEQAGGERGQINLGDLTGLISSRKNLADVRKLPMIGRVPWEGAEEHELSGLRKRELDARISQIEGGDPLLALRKKQLEQQTDEGIFGARKEQEQLRVRQLQDTLDPASTRNLLDEEQLSRVRHETDPARLAIEDLAARQNAQRTALELEKSRRDLYERPYRRDQREETMRAAVDRGRQQERSRQQRQRGGQ